MWSVAPTTSHASEWDVLTLKKLGGNSVLSSVWQSLKERNQAGHYKRSAVEDLCTVSYKKPRRMPADHHQSKGTSVTNVPSIVSDISVLSPCMGSATACSNSVSTPLLNQPVVEAKQRKRRRAKRKCCLQTPKITEWLLGCPSPSQAIPCPENPAPPIPKSEQNSKKKRRRPQRKTRRSQQETPPSQAPIPKDPNGSFPAVPAVACLDGQRDGRRPSSMSPELRPRQCSLDPALLMCTDQLFGQEDGPSKEV